MDKTYYQNGTKFETIYFQDYSDWKKFPIYAKSPEVKMQWQTYWSKRSEIVGDFENAQDLVLEILKKVPSTRNSDKKLFYEIFKYYKIPIKLEDLESIPSLESFTRARRKIQETEYQPEEEVQEQREQNENDMRGYMSEI